MAKPMGNMIIELGLDSAGFTKNLKGASQAVKNATSEMRNNFKIIDSGGNKLDAMKSKYTGLEKVITAQKNEVDKLTEAYKDSYTETGEATNKTAALAKKVNDAQGRLASYESQLKSTGREIRELGSKSIIVGKNLSAMGDKMKNVGSKFSGFGNKLTNGITKPVTAAVTAMGGFVLFKGFQRLVGIDQATAKLRGLGHDTKTVSTIMDSALASVKGTSFGMDEAATTAASAVAAGIEPGKQLTKYLSLTGDAAAIAGVSMSEMGSIVNKVQTGQHAYTEELNQLADKGLPIYQWVAKEAGVTAGEVKSMASDGKISSEMFLAAIENNIGGAAQKMGEYSFTAQLSNMGAAIGRIGANFLDAGGQGGGFFSIIKPLLTELTDKMTVFEDKASEMGVKFGEMVMGAIDKLKGWKASYDDLTSGQQDKLKKILSVTSLVLVAMGPIFKIVGFLMTTFGGLFSVIGAGMTKFGLFTAEFETFGAVITAIVTGPVGIAVAIAAIAGAFALAYFKIDSFREKVDAIMTYIYANIIKPAVDAIVAFFQTQLAKITTFWNENGTQIKLALSNISNGIKAFMDFIQPVLTIGFNIIKSVISVVWGNIKGIISGALDVIMGVIKIFTGLFTGDWKLMWEGIKQAVWGAVQVVWNWISLMFIGKILTGIGGLATGAKSLVSGMWTGIKTFFSGGITSVANGVSGFVVRLKGFFSGLGTGTVNTINSMWTGIKSFFSGGITGVGNGVSAFVGKIKGFFSGMKSGLTNTVKSMWTDITSKFSSNITTLVDKVKNMPSLMADGIRKGASALKDAFVSMWKGAATAISNPANKIIGGANWILDKFGSKTKIAKWEPYAKGTDGHKGGHALVNDQKGSTYREAVQLPNGNTFMPQGRNVLLPNLPKGSKVLPANETKGMYRYKNGVGEWFSGMWDKTKAVGSKIKDTALDVFEFMSNPGDLVKNVISKFVDYDGMSGIALSMGKGLVGKVTGGMGDWVKKLFESDTGAPAGKGVERWRPTVAKALSMNGLPSTDAYIGAWLRQISSESGGNEKAVQGNIGDINNKTGDLAKGLVQVIGQTFNAYKFPGHNNRLNGLDSLLAGINYAKSRYGKDGMLNVIGKGHGYANGGLVTRHQFAEIAEGNKPEMVIPLTRKARAISLIQKAQDILGMDNDKTVTVQQNSGNNDNGELVAMLKAQVELLKAILNKNADVYLDGKKIGDYLDQQDRLRIQDAEGRVFT